MSIFEKRVNYKPFEYPEVMKFVDAMNNTFWVHSEVDFTSDMHDYKVKISESEREVIKRSLLSIAQVEVGVKTFWGDLYRHFPKPEFANLGSTLAESETRHSEAYARLLEVLGLEIEFKNLLEIDVFQKKLDLIERSLYNDTSIIHKLLFFTIIIENASLFSQFANILSFTRFKGFMKKTSNIIAWTSMDEQIHANAGEFLLVELEKEGFIQDQLKEELMEDILEYIEYEKELLDWIYEEGELDFFSKEDLLNFMKYRIDESLSRMHMDKLFNVTEEEYKPMEWFDEDVFANSMIDFFASRPTDYTKHDKSITARDLF